MVTERKGVSRWYTKENPIHPKVSPFSLYRKMMAKRKGVSRLGTVPAHPKVSPFRSTAESVADKE
ncbi:hypothetical protein FPK48_01155 [Acinetobacter baumannii]|uniref:Uncharacterized protein n=1 Tax=Acinetobacter baumannii TaxID=470 RepID=A0A2S5C1N6_ACIBA|nr:hypothetical protein [Acinetobacter baumannii]KAA5585450.1 hypothetical protein F3G14_03290 [Acinetobacter baumannii]KAA8928789.1 hypothetical protein DLI67_02740 [Acinetobacter baumannii]KAA8937284.1 hypothetical protein DLI68_03565 [Acinetobacter baumannii]KAA9219818.1 hypothetical protein A6Y97_13170 [Acinetobacter baumannii]